MVLVCQNSDIKNEMQVPIRLVRWRELAQGRLFDSRLN